MDLWLVVTLYVLGLGLLVGEAFMPGLVMGLVGLASLATSVVFGFKHHWLLGGAQVLVAAGVAPLALYVGIRKLVLRSSLEGSISFARDYAALAGREGVSETDLRPAGIAFIDGKKVDVVTGGELVEKGRPVRVVKVEGNRIVVRGL
jgi:membrane-bound serine protease (ClpP class)